MTDSPELDPRLLAYLEKLKKEMIGEPHILNPFNPIIPQKKTKEPYGNG